MSVRFQLIIAFALAFPYVAIAQEFQITPGGEPSTAARMLNERLKTRQRPQTFRLKQRFGPQAKTLSPKKPNDVVSQISPFPFEGTYRDGSYYDESCPFTLSNGDLLVVYANSSFDSLFSIPIQSDNDNLV